MHRNALLILLLATALVLVAGVSMVSAQFGFPIFLPVVPNESNTVQSAADIPPPPDDSLSPTKPHPAGVKMALEAAKDNMPVVLEVIDASGPSTAGKSLVLGDGSILQLPANVYIETYFASGICESALFPETHADVYCPTFPVVSLRQVGDPHPGLDVELQTKQALGSTMVPPGLQKAEAMKFEVILEQLGAETIIVDGNVMPLGAVK